LEDSKNYNLMIVAGEASGDAHAARLVRELAASGRAGFGFFGAVSHELRAAGVEVVVDADHLAVVGLPEIARALPMFLGAFRRLRDAAAKRRPDAAILVDFPDFNLRLARSLRKLRIPVIYYVSPQVWAWRQYRLRAIKRDVDLLLTILPFEKEWYAARGFAKVEFVGSPSVREVHPSVGRGEFRTRHGFDLHRPLVALLPGSRHKEIARILPVMLETAAAMSRREPGIQFVIALAATRHPSEIDDAFARCGVGRDSFPLAVVRGETYDALHASDAAAVTSGTATLETGILGTPLAIVYKTSAINYRLFRPLISVEHFGLINLVAEERVAAELIQAEFSAETLGPELFRLLEPETNASVRAKLAAAAEKLGHGGASKRAADAILRFLANRPDVT
jgi:lipid-A-disaccharide synthase